MTSPQISDPVVAPIVTGLLDCLTVVFAQLDAQTEQPPRPVCVRPGATASLLASQSEDECCLRLAWLRVDAVFPSGQGRFPEPDETAQPCDVIRWAVSIELGASRCAPVGDGMTLPTCEESGVSGLHRQDRRSVSW
jgi:hypothetical protein